MITRLDIRVIPRASKNEISGMRDGRIVVRVMAPPVDSAANEAVIAVLAKALGLPKGSLRISAGQSNRNKTIAIDGMDRSQVEQMLRA